MNQKPDFTDFIYQIIYIASNLTINDAIIFSMLAYSILKLWQINPIKLIGLIIIVIALFLIGQAVFAEFKNIFDMINANLNEITRAVEQVNRATRY